MPNRRDLGDWATGIGAIVRGTERGGQAEKRARRDQGHQPPLRRGA